MSCCLLTAKRDVPSGYALPLAPRTLCKGLANLGKLRRGVNGLLVPLESQALAWGQTNAGGAFELQNPVPRGNRYAVAVIATGYHPVAADDGLTVADDAPDLFDPWDEIQLEKK